MEKQPIKIMQIIARMNVGGPAILVSSLVRELNSEGFETTLISGYCEENELDFLETVATDIKCTKIKGLGRKVSIFSDFKSLVLLIKQIRDFQPDIIHTHTIKAGVLGRVASIISLHKSYRVHTFHGHLLTGYFRKSIVFAIIWIEKALAFKTDILLAVGTKVRDDLVSAGIAPKNKFKITYPGLQRFNSKHSFDIRKELDIQNQIMIVFVGRLTKIKRPDRFIQAALTLNDLHSEVVFVVVGDGELLESLKELTAHSSAEFRFMGWRNDVEDIIQASDIVALTSDNEGIPLTLIQACQSGKPIVATKAGSVSDVVTDGKNGYLTELSVKEFAESLRKLIKDNDSRVKFGSEGIKIAAEKFSMESMINQHKTIYSQQIHTPY